MTTYTAIPNGDIDQDSPVTQPLMTLMRDNPIAISEGAAGAPRVLLKAIEELTAGNTTRASYDTEQDGTGSEFTAYSFQFIQRGTVRGYAEVRETAASSVNLRFKRKRSGTTTTLQTDTTGSNTYVSFTYDFDVLPGDLLLITFDGTGAAQNIRNCRFQTAGENIWPAFEVDSGGTLTNDYT